MKLLQSIVTVAFLFIIVGCSTASLITTEKPMPAVYEDKNETHEKKNNVTISLFRLQNYTDTPRAGMRASNIPDLGHEFQRKAYITRF